MTQIEQKFEQSIGRAFRSFTEYLEAKLKFLKKIHDRE